MCASSDSSRALGRVWTPVVTLSMIVAVACGRDAPAVSADPAPAVGDAGADDASEPDSAADASFAADASDVPVLDAGTRPVTCGNGERGADEACDDGNVRGGDGCSADCLAVEQGFACQPAGAACRRIEHCGDGMLAGSEQCDDANARDGDGCSARCKLERGFRCDGQPSACSVTTCGDGRVEGAEACDDGNQRPFDGCSADCQSEPVCPARGACASRCGDGLVLNEDCDDGNTEDGDGCSALCKVELGFTCSSTCERKGGACVLRVSAIYRDFQESHVDFDSSGSCSHAVQGVVAASSSEQRKPVLVDGRKACIDSEESFAAWYTDGPDSVPVVSEIVLYDDGEGGFVNRYWASGEPWRGLAQEPFDGNPLFFPLDDLPLAAGDTRLPATIPEQYGYPGFPWEDTVFADAPPHNFLFTTEVAYWFTYQSTTRARLEFSGDDDIWVFLNGTLAVELAGTHNPEGGGVTIDETSAVFYGLSPGSVYEIRVFHAERKPSGSSFRLTLTGFDTSPSACTAICGDGLIKLGEECDDGANDGGYEECAPGCVLGPRCGDAIVQDGEDCDDGNRRDSDRCGSSCRQLLVL